jgi:hypothetical protein
MAESSLNTGALNGGDGNDGTDSIGIGQWNSDRARNLKAFAEQSHTDWRDYGTQLAFVQHELTHSEGGAANLLKGAKDVKSATEAMIMYERPAGFRQGTAERHRVPEAPGIRRSSCWPGHQPRLVQEPLPRTAPGHQQRS